MGLLDQADFSVFKQAETWKAFGIAALMFVSISFAALSMFDSMDEVFASDVDPIPIPNLVFESLNRTGHPGNFIPGAPKPLDLDRTLAQNIKSQEQPDP